MKDYKNFSDDKSKNANDQNLIDVLTKTLGDKSQGNLLQTIISQAEDAKKNGTLTNADLDNFYNNLAPLFDGLRRAKLKQIINKLKSL